jgi:hypothetical protein
MGCYWLAHSRSPHLATHSPINLDRPVATGMMMTPQPLRTGTAMTRIRLGPGLTAKKLRTDPLTTVTGVATSLMSNATTLSTIVDEIDRNEVPRRGFEPRSSRFRRDAFTRLAYEAKWCGLGDSNSLRRRGTPRHSPYTKSARMVGRGRIRTSEPRRDVIYSHAALAACIPARDLGLKKVVAGRGVAPRSSRLMRPLGSLTDQPASKRNPAKWKPVRRKICATR